MTTNLAGQFPNQVSPKATLREKDTKSEWTPTQAVEGLIVINNLHQIIGWNPISCLLYTSPSPRDKRQSRMPSSA